MKNDQIEGPYVDVVTLLERSSKMRISKLLVPYARTVKTVLLDQNNLTMMFDTQVLEHKSTKIAPLFDVNSYILMSRNNKKVSTLGNIQNLVIGRMRGGCLDVNEEKYKIKFEDFNTFEIGLNQLLKNRLDGICGTKIGFNYFLKRMNHSISDFGPLILTSKRTVYLHASPLMTAENKTKWIEAVSSIKKDPKFKKILESL